MPKTSTVDPRWVLSNDRLCEVSEFAHLPSKDRPQVICPLCKLAVVLKLGKVRAHHYAHREEADCTANHPETALHLNTKFHFYNELLRAEIKTLRVKLECGGCDATTTRVWLKDWDEVQVEYQMDPFRPDIALLKEGNVVAALEILVTHAVDERKAAFFGAESIKWAEIRASEPLYSGQKAWRAARPLPPDADCSDLDDWTCGS